MPLHVAPDFTLPDEAATETFAILGKRGAGKSSTAVVLAEEMHAAGIPWVAIDPKGDWHGIRSDGDRPGLPVPVFGGLHGDLPLTPAAGPLMARLVVERNMTCVLDVSDFDTKADQVRFVTAFARELWKLIRHRTPQPLHLFLEEAEEFLPQVQRERGGGEVPAMIGMYAKLAKQGRSFGLGVTLVTQRSASVSKDALSQTETLILHRTTSPHDKNAVSDWVDDPAFRTEVKASLSSLAPGEAWVLSPGFLGRSFRVQWRRRSTFDSGATPTLGKMAAPRSTAKIDLDEIETLLSDVRAEAEQDDPKALRRRVAELEALLSAAAPSTEVEVREVVPDWVTIAADELRECATRASDYAAAAAKAAEDAVGVAANAQVEATRLLGKLNEHTTAPAASAPPRPRPRPVPAAPAERPPARINESSGEGRMLAALAEWPNGLTRSQLATQAGLKKRGGTFGTYLSRLRTSGYVTVDGDKVDITDAGLEAAGGRRPPKSAAELQDFWRARFSGGALRMFDHLVDVYPRYVTRDELAEAAGVARSGGTFGTYLSRLVSNDCAVTDGNEVAAHPNLFP